MKIAKGLLVAAGVTMSPSVALAAGDGGVDWLTLGASIVNTAIYLTLIVVFAGKPIKAFYDQRRAAIADNIEKSKQLYAEAQSQLTEYQGRLAKLDAEIEAVRVEFRALAEAEKERILADAEVQAGKIRADAQRSADALVRRARADVERQLVEKAVGMARDQVVAEARSAEVQARLVDAYIRDLDASSRAQA